ncbi:MAG TPA: class I SAM-dependent methyltransferase [Pseudonocardiaceae bacterium]|nr:class I SAM-dependent methyltransferase [Pseudonocardiaceae bacterium]
MARIAHQIQLRGFGLPSGPLGRLGGALMARGNAETERRLVQLAGLHGSDTVLVLGPGPGIGLAAAAGRAGRVVGVEPSELMLASCARRCAELAQRGQVRLVRGDAEHTGQPDAAMDVALSVNNVMFWPDLAAGLAEVSRVLRPGGRLLVSAHDRWLPGGATALGIAVRAAGFTDVQTWTWQPPGNITQLAAQLRAVKPA